MSSPVRVGSSKLVIEMEVAAISPPDDKDKEYSPGLDNLNHG